MFRRNRSKEQPAPALHASAPQAQPQVETVVSHEVIPLTHEEIVRGLELDQARLDGIYRDALDRGLTQEEAIAMLQEGVTSGEIPAFTVRLPDSRDGVDPRLYVPELLKAIERRDTLPFPIEVLAYPEGAVGVYIRKKANSASWQRAIATAGVDSRGSRSAENNYAALAALRELLDESGSSQE